MKKLNIIFNKINNQSYVKNQRQQTFEDRESSMYSVLYELSSGEYTCSHG
jgi:hypothetical protein